MTVHDWAQSNPQSFEQILDCAIRDNLNTEEIKTAVAECICETGFQSSGCSAIDGIANQVQKRIAERIKFEGELYDDAEADESDADDDRRERQRFEKDRDDAMWEDEHDRRREELRTIREFEGQLTRK